VYFVYAQFVDVPFREVEIDVEDEFRLSEDKANIHTTFEITVRI